MVVNQPVRQPNQQPMKAREVARLGNAKEARGFVEGTAMDGMAIGLFVLVERYIDCQTYRRTTPKQATDTTKEQALPIAFTSIDCNATSHCFMHVVAYDQSL